MIKNLHNVLFLVLVLIILGVIGNAVLEGVNRIITQNMIDDTYKIHK